MIQFALSLFLGFALAAPAPTPTPSFGDGESPYDTPSAINNHLRALEWFLSNPNGPPVVFNKVVGSSPVQLAAADSDRFVIGFAVPFLSDSDGGGDLVYGPSTVTSATGFICFAGDIQWIRWYANASADWWGVSKNGVSFTIRVITVPRPQ